MIEVERSPAPTAMAEHDLDGAADVSAVSFGYPRLVTAYCTLRDTRGEFIQNHAQLLIHC
jgi:hypothetical protein